MPSWCFTSSATCRPKAVSEMQKPCVVRSCSGVVTLSGLGRGLSVVDQVSAWRLTKFQIVVLVTPKRRAIWLLFDWIINWTMPIAINRSSFDKRGFFRHLNVEALLMLYFGIAIELNEKQSLAIYVLTHKRHKCPKVWSSG